MEKILVLGSGSFGCSIANSLAPNNKVFLWSHHEKEKKLIESTWENPLIKGAKINPNITVTCDISMVNNVDYIFYVVPSFALREVSKKINEVLKDKKKFVICTKGLEADTMKSGYEIVNEEVEKVDFVSILSGPTHAEELAFEKITTIVSTAVKESDAQEIQKLFDVDYVRIYTNIDINGVELLGAAKNVLAIAAGICDSHPRLGDNAKAALLTRGLRELKIIGETQGCNPNTFYGLTGLGDLVVTATSKHSRNRKFGELIGKGLTKEEAQKEVGMVVEGVYSVQALQQLNEKCKTNLPIVEGIYKILFKGYKIEDVLEEFSNRELKKED